MNNTEDLDWQRLDKFLWHARVRKTRPDCAALVAEGHVRINRQPTEKPHAKLRIGDVLAFPWGSQVKIWRVAKLAVRRGPPAEARALYDEIMEPSPCTGAGSPAYPPSIDPTHAPTGDPP